MQRVFDDDRFPTRLGILQVTLRLARDDDGQLVAWAGEGPLGWQSSEVRVPAVRYNGLAGVDQERPEIAAIRANWPSWMQESVLLAPVRSSGLICEGLRYSATYGAEFVK